MKIEFKRLIIKDHLDYFYDLYLTNREFFRRIAPDLRKEDILNIEAISQGNFYIIYDEETPLGLSFLCRIDNSGLSCHLGFLLDKDFQDKQVAEGSKLAFYIARDFIKYIFRNTHLRKVSMCFLKTRTDIENSLTKGGFHKEAEFKDSVYFDGKFQDEIEYAIFKDKFITLYGEIS